MNELQDLCGCHLLYNTHNKVVCGKVLDVKTLQLSNDCVEDEEDVEDEEGGVGEDVVEGEEEILCLCSVLGMNCLH